MNLSSTLYFNNFLAVYSHQVLLLKFICLHRNHISCCYLAVSLLQQYIFFPLSCCKLSSNFKHSCTICLNSCSYLAASFLLSHNTLAAILLQLYVLDCFIMISAWRTKQPLLLCYKKGVHNL